MQKIRTKIDRLIIEYLDFAISLKRRRVINSYSVEHNYRSRFRVTELLLIVARFALKYVHARDLS